MDQEFTLFCFALHVKRRPRECPPHLHSMLGKKGFQGEPGWLRVSAEAFSLFSQFTTSGSGDAATISIGCRGMRFWSGDAEPGAQGLVTTWSPRIACSESSYPRNMAALMGKPRTALTVMPLKNTLRPSF